jgi:hypothetical protein
MKMARNEMARNENGKKCHSNIYYSNQNNISKNK